MRAPSVRPPARSPVEISATVVPVLAIVALVAVWERDLPVPVEIVVVALLAGAVLVQASVHLSLCASNLFLATNP